MLTGDPNFKNKMGEVLLEEVAEKRDLEVMITWSCISSKQCYMTAAKANWAFGVITKTITSRDSTIITKLYKSLVRPHLDLTRSDIALQSEAAY